MTKDREQELLKRIDALEAKVRELEARPAQQHHHYHYQSPAYPIYQPLVPPGPTWTSAPYLADGYSTARG